MYDATLARAESLRGEVVLRRRPGDGELELRVNGAFVMDTRETGTERRLAMLAIDALLAARGHIDAGSLRVLVGGLGLGCTLVQLARSPLVAQILVAEIEPALVDWHRAGLVPHTVETLRDRRVSVNVVDILDEVSAQPDGSLDAIVLDIDNGPGYLVYDDNAAVYEEGFLTCCRRALAADGRLVIWSGHSAPDLHGSLQRVFASADAHIMDVTLGSRLEHYYAYVAPSSSGQQASCQAH